MDSITEEGIQMEITATLLKVIGGAVGKTTETAVLLIHYSQTIMPAMVLLQEVYIIRNL
jgi:hypothetical protein